MWLYDVILFVSKRPREHAVVCTVNGRTTSRSQDNRGYLVSLARYYSSDVTVLSRGAILPTAASAK